MNKNWLRKIIFQIAPFLLRKGRDYIIYLNILLFIGGCVWLFVFVKTYYLDVAQDFIFMEQNANILYQVSPNTKLYAEISAKYDKKVHSVDEIPEGLVSPF